MTLPMHAESKSTLLSRLRTLGVAVLVLWSEASGVAAHAAQTPPNPAPQPTTADDQADKPGFQGIELGDFLVRTYYPIEAQKSVVTFTLYATVKDEDAAEFERLLENRRQKVRDQTIVATRLVPVADFNDPQLASFRRRILLRLHRTLPDLPIQDAYLTNFEIEVESF